MESKREVTRRAHIKPLTARKEKAVDLLQAAERYRSTQSSRRSTPKPLSGAEMAAVRGRDERTAMKQPRTAMGGVIQGYEEGIKSQDRISRKYFCEPESAETYAQVRGGGGMTQKELRETPEPPARMRHLRAGDVDPREHLPPMIAPSLPLGQQKTAANHEGQTRTGPSDQDLLHMDDEKLTETIWRLPSGAVGDIRKGELDAGDEERDKPLTLLPGTLRLSPPARLQMELIATVVASKARGFIRGLLQQCSTTRGLLSREGLRRGIKMLNVEPHEEILTALMGGRRVVQAPP